MMTELIGQSVCCGAKLVNVDTGVIGMVVTCAACGQATERKVDPDEGRKRAFNSPTPQKKPKQPKKLTAQEILEQEASAAKEIQRRLKQEFLSHQERKVTLPGQLSAGGEVT